MNKSMPSVLFLIQTKSDFLIEQAEMLAQFLSQQGFETTVAINPNPLRLFSKRYDLIHLLAEDVHFSSKLLATIFLAKSLNQGLILSLFGTTSETKFHLKLFDSVTVPNLSMLNQMKNVDRFKMIFPGLLKTQSPLKKKNTASTQSMKQVFIFPILGSIQDLPENIHLNDSTIIVDASKCSPETIRKLKLDWFDWKKQNLFFDQASLVTHRNTLEKLALQDPVVLITSHLTLSSQQLLEYVEFVIRHKMRWIANPNQASGFSQAWSKIQNRIITDKSLTFLDQTFTQVDPFNLSANEMNEPKLNEIARAYQKVLTKIHSHNQSSSDKIQAV